MTTNACKNIINRLVYTAKKKFFSPFNSQSVLDQAKRNVESEFAVVGVLEDLNTTLAVLEKYIPRFFKGATQIYFDEIKKFLNINRNENKPKVSEEVKNIVRKNISREIEFYEFCKERLQKQSESS
jgi:dermatan/chondrotin sulfate uronyl 2-O-sulfotransferase UST